MDDAGPRSLFVVLDYAYVDPPYFSIVQLDTREQDLETIVDQKEDVIRFNQEPQGRPSIRWLFSPPTSSTDTEDLYIVPNWGFDNCPVQTVKPLHGYKFNLRTGSCQPITPPLSSLMHGHVVNLTGRIYFLAHDWRYDKQSVFQCYDPEKNLWNPLEPFPHDRAVLGVIVGTAVLGDTILFNVDSCNIWAYDVIRNKWYPVEVEDRRCYGFIGEAVVLGDTIYALTNRSFYRILVLSIKKKGTDCDLAFKCSLCSDHYVPGIELIFEQSEAWIRTRHLVHMGKDNFCLVQSCNLAFFEGYLPIQLTYIKFVRGNWMTVKECIHKVIIQGPGLTSDLFEFRLCFSLPKGATTVLKEGKIFNLKPYPVEDYASNPVPEEEIVTPFPEEEIVTPVQEEEIVTLHKDGLHATCELFQDQ